MNHSLNRASGQTPLTILLSYSLLPLTYVVELYNGKGYPQVCGEKIGKRILSVVMDCLMESSERGIFDEQYGFRKDTSCSYKFIVVGQLSGKMNEKVTFTAVIEVEKPYAIVDQETKWQVTEICGVGVKFLQT